MALARVTAAVTADWRRRAATGITRSATVAGGWVMPRVPGAAHLGSRSRRAGGRPTPCPFCCPPQGFAGGVKRDACLAANPPPCSRRPTIADLEEEARRTSDRWIVASPTARGPPTTVAWERTYVGCPPPHRHAGSWSEPALARRRRGAGAHAQRPRSPTGGAAEVTPHGSGRAAPVSERLTRLPLWREAKRRGGRRRKRPRAAHGRPPEGSCGGRSGGHGGRWRRSPRPLPRG